VGDEENLCLLCNKIFSNCSLAPAELKIGFGKSPHHTKIKILIFLNEIGEL